MERLSLIDLSSRDDSLLSCSPRASLPSPQSPGIDNGLKGENPAEISKRIEILELLESQEPKGSTIGEFNLRNSLAWDSAFFTSEGVLNSEELASLSSIFRKGEAHTLPAIQEDARKSTESTSTKASSCWELEKLESNFFEGLQVSIQTSSGKCYRPSSMAYSSKATGQEGRDAPSLDSMKKVAVPSQNKMKSPVKSKKHDISKQQPEEALIHRQMATTGVGGSKISSKSPRTVGRATPVTMITRKDYSASENIQITSNTKKVYSGKAVNRQPVAASKKIMYGSSCNVTSRTSPLPKSSSGLPLGKSGSSKALHSSYSSSLRTASDSSCKSSFDISRKVNNVKCTTHLSGSTIETSLSTLKGKTGSKNPGNLLASPNSSLKLLSCASPCASLDSGASESTSFTSSASKQSNSGETFDVASTSSSLAPFDFDVTQPSDSQKSCIDQSYIGIENSGLISQNLHITKSPSGSHALVEPSSSLDHSKICISNSIADKGFKPSGLRTPTPKIGYFDVGKSLQHDPKRYPRIGVETTRLQDAAGINKIVKSSNLKHSKIRSAGPATLKVTMNFNTQHSQSIHPSSMHSMKLAPPTSPHQLPRTQEVRLTSRMANTKYDLLKMNEILSPRIGLGSQVKNVGGSWGCK